MEEIIEKMIEIEEEAQNIVSKAREKEGHFDGEIKRETDKMKNDILKKSRERCESVQKYESEEAEKLLKGIAAELEENLKKIENTARENSVRWVEDLMNTVIK